MSWSLPTITARTRVAAAAKAVAAFLTQTAEQTGHDRDRNTIAQTIQEAAIVGLEREPSATEQVVITGYGSATGGYSYEKDGQTVTVPVTGISLTLNVSIQPIPTPAPATGQ